MSLPSLFQLANKAAVDVYDQELRSQGTINPATLLPSMLLVGSDRGRSFRAWARPELQLALAKIWIRSLGYATGRADIAQQYVASLPVCWRSVKRIATKTDDQTTLQFVKDAKPALKNLRLARLLKLAGPILEQRIRQKLGPFLTILAVGRIAEDLQQAGKILELKEGAPVPTVLEQQIKVRLKSVEKELVNELVNEKKVGLCNSPAKQRKMLDSAFALELVKALENPDHKLGLLECLIEAGANPDLLLDMQCGLMHIPMTPIQRAIEVHHLGLTMLLTSYGANIDDPEIIGTTPLAQAVSSDENLEISRRLLHWGADPKEQKTLFMATCIATAAATGALRTAELIIEHGDDVNEKCGDLEKTPLMIAAESGNRAMVELLLTANADQLLRNAHGHTAADIAEDSGYTAIAHYLRDAASADLSFVPQGQLNILPYPSWLQALDAIVSSLDRLWLVDS